MRVCIVGCGAVGSLFAAHLAQADGVEVWAYDVVRPHVDAINRDGLRLTGEDMSRIGLDDRQSEGQGTAGDLGRGYAGMVSEGIQARADLRLSERFGH